MNVFTAVVRLGTDAEQRFTPNGDSVVSFNGAVDSGFGDKKITTWIRYAMFGKRGESVLPYLKKGAQIAVSGELSNRKWADKEGQDRYSLECRVNDLTLIGGKPEVQSQNQDDAPAPKRQQAQQKESFDELGNDIPF